MDNNNQNSETKQNICWQKEEENSEHHTEPLSLDEIREVIREIRY